MMIILNIFSVLPFSINQTIPSWLLFHPSVQFFRMLRQLFWLKESLKVGDRYKLFRMGSMMLTYSMNNCCALLFCSPKVQAFASGYVCIFLPQQSGPPSSSCPAVSPLQFPPSPAWSQSFWRCPVSVCPWPHRWPARWGVTSCLAASWLGCAPGQTSCCWWFSEQKNKPNS